ncbi:hypothetical protein GXW74_12750 [Roseomonas eburnea]|uniref:Uncharacterized protein n=1 Tax=Neoroseomonas eburnea TaxID=1346889 RepID=A0A9X9XCC1_9PROT|nr:hypothetical protein [Neoroseomonas eburnea]MBR0681357.1 hypothetical protein [Neoroseomonas eburnea]
MLSSCATYRVESTRKGRDEVLDFDRTVPPRGRGRENWHRERFCILNLLAHLQCQTPSLFPAELVRQQAPDFLLRPTVVHSPIAIEHTDAGAHEYQCVLDEDAERDERAPVTIGARRSDTGQHAKFDGRVSNAPEQCWLQDIRDAIRRKSHLRCWRNAPPNAQRWILAFDNSGAGIFVDDDAARAMLSQALSINETVGAKILAFALVRRDMSVLLQHAAATA